MADEGWVTIRHPEVGVSPNKVHQSAFDSTWEALGWEIVPDEAATASEAAGRTVDGYDSLTKAQLVDLADSRGLDASGTKADLISALRATD